MKNVTATLLLSLVFCFYAEAAETILPSKPDGEVAGHGYVDLGLPSGTLWAACNIDAETPYLPGSYFAWGETQGREYFRWLDYQYLEDYSKNADIQYTYTVTDIGDDISATAYDAARTLWGDCWRIPTEEDWEELNEYCTMEYKEYSSIPPRKGMLICGPNGNRIFISGTYSPRYIDLGPVRTAEYWTATATTDLAWDKYPAAVMMTFGTKGSKLNLIPEGRHEGFAVRPVISRQDIGTSVAALTETEPDLRYENGVVFLNGFSSGHELTVSDISGRRIYSCPVVNESLQLPTLSKGIYILTVSKDVQGNAIKISIP